jgi:hypothetical protein
MPFYLPTHLAVAAGLPIPSGYGASDPLNDPLPVPVPTVSLPVTWGEPTPIGVGRVSPVAATFPMGFYGNARAGLTDFVFGKVPRVLESYRSGYARSRRFRRLRV